MFSLMFARIRDFERDNSSFFAQILRPAHPPRLELHKRTLCFSALGR
jgi:hypothetical protein